METVNTTSSGMLDKEELMPQILVPTRRLKRLANNLLDTFFFYTFFISIGAVLGFIVVMTGGDLNSFSSVPAGVDTIFSILALATYYICFEHFFGKSLGKMITNTKVVSADGSKPPLKNIIGRSFARLIPFDAFTFLSKNPVGWHDSLSNTMVVDDIKLFESKDRN